MIQEKVKARALVQKFTHLGETKEIAKSNVIMMIDEIALKLAGHHKDAIQTPFIKYWKEVKREVNSL